MMAASLVVFGVALVGFTGVIVALIMINSRRERARRQRISALATQRGWTYVVNPDRRVVDRYFGDPFHRYGGGDVRDMITGTHRGRPFLAFQYTYSRQTGTQGGRTSHSLTHVAIPLPGAGPRATIKRQDVVSRLSEGFGSRRFILGAPPFDLRFDVRGENDAFTRALFGRGLAPWLMSLPNALPLTVEHTELRTWSNGRLSEVLVLGLADHLCTALERMPIELWRPLPA